MQDQCKKQNRDRKINSRREEKATGERNREDSEREIKLKRDKHQFQYSLSNNIYYLN